MTAAVFRRLALALPGAMESSHLGAPDFRVGGRIFATLAHERKGFGNLMLKPDQQAEFVAGRPDLFLPVTGGWGQQGCTHMRLAAADEATAAGALRAAWQVRLDANAKQRRRPSPRRARP